MQLLAVSVKRGEGRVIYLQTFDNSNSTGGVSLSHKVGSNRPAGTTSAKTSIRKVNTD